MPQPWFANRGQIAQLVAQIGTLALAAVNARRDFRMGAYFTVDTLIFYGLISGVVGAVGYYVRELRRHRPPDAAAPPVQPNDPPDVDAHAVIHDALAPFRPRPLTLVEQRFERAPADTSWTHPSKLRLVFTNTTRHSLHVLAPEWLAEQISDVPAQHPQAFCSLQVEGSRGWHANDWSAESARVQVGPGRTFRLWIGLDPSVSDTQLRLRAEQKRLGTLVLPYKTGDGYHEFRQRL